MVGPYTCHNAKKFLKAATNSSNTFVPTLAISHTPIPTPTEAPALPQSFVSTPDLPDKYMGEDLQRATKLITELFL